MLFRNPKTRRPSKATYKKATQTISNTMKPWRPAKLFREAFTPIPGHMEPVGREDERFREHFEKEPGIVKYGPWYALERWFVRGLPIVTPDDFILIPLNGNDIRSGQEEALRRLPNMVIRNPRADPVVRQMAAINGFAVEHHVKSYFRQSWPSSYMPASNENQFERPAPDDFTLILDGCRFAVDVARSTNKYPVKWKLRKRKMRGATLRIVAYYNDTHVVIQGYTFKDDDCYEVWPIERLIVRLNIQKMGIGNYFPPLIDKVKVA